MTTLARLFTDHPASVQESYFDHLAFAARFSALLFTAAVVALVHAVLPFLFEKTAGRITLRLAERIRSRG